MLESLRWTGPFAYTVDGWLRPYVDSAYDRSYLPAQAHGPGADLLGTDPAPAAPEVESYSAPQAVAESSDAKPVVAHSDPVEEPQDVDQRNGSSEGDDGDHPAPPEDRGYLDGDENQQQVKRESFKALPGEAARPGQGGGDEVGHAEPPSGIESLSDPGKFGQGGTGGQDGPGATGGAGVTTGSSGQPGEAAGGSTD